jgi:glutamate-1-semialdehyde 2,1-aminomutase
MMVETHNELTRYQQMTPKSRERWLEATEYLPGGDSRHSIFWDPYPIFVESASGCHVIDADGTDRLDFINTMTTMILGHGPAPVLDAARQQMELGLAYNSPNRHQVELAKLLCERIPSFDRVRFTNSGTEATLNTIRAARAFTGRSKFAKVEGGYHGTHDAVLVSLRIDPATGGAYDHPEPVASSAGLADGVLDQAVIVPYNDVDVARRILEENREDLAAVIVEPIMGSVGMLPADPAYLSMLRDFADDSGALLIFDEVISFRVAPGGAQEYYGVTPDMTALGKIIGGGFPVGAFGGRSDIMAQYSPVNGAAIAHGGTFNANPISMAAGVATLNELTPTVYRRLAELTEMLRQGIRQVCSELEQPVVVTGAGSLFGIHFASGPLHNYRDIAASDKDLARQVFIGMLNEGFLLAPNLVGALSTSLGEVEIDAFVRGFKRVLQRQID